MLTNFFKSPDHEALSSAMPGARYCGVSLEINHQIRIDQLKMNFFSFCVSKFETKF